MPGNHTPSDSTRSQPMMIRTDCPNCGQGYNGADSQLGKPETCKSCNEPFEVSHASARYANGASQSPPREEADRPVRRRPRYEEEDSRPTRRRSREDDYEDDRPAR